MRRVRYIDLSAQFREEQAELMPRIEQVLASGVVIGGPEIDALETELAAYCGVAHAVALNSGSDALALGMTVAGVKPGDEVITPPNSFVASTSSITRIGAVPVFADVRDDELLDPAAVEASITPRTVAIMPVHLRGAVCDMDALWRIARRHNLLIIEDAAQAMGTSYRGSRTGTLGTVGCFSAHPLKNFNAAGDAGFLTTGSREAAERARRLRNSGLKDRDTVVEWGVISRMDALQAAILRLRLRRLDGVIARRRANTATYRELLADLPLWLPHEPPDEFHTYHNFVVQCDTRDALQSALAESGIEAFVHYARPIHWQPAAKELGYREGQFPVTERLSRRILSLPIHQFLSAEDLHYVGSGIRRFFTERS